MLFSTDFLGEPLLYGLLRSTLIVSVGFCLVEGFLRFFKTTSVPLRQLCWITVLFLGWILFRPVLTLPPDNNHTESYRLLSVEYAVNADSMIKQTLAGVFSENIIKGFARLCVVVWISGIVFFLIRAYKNHVALSHILCSSAEPPAQWSEQWEKLLKIKHNGDQTQMRVSTHFGPRLVPKFFGLSGYVLVIPSELWKKLDANERLSLLKIELAHIKQFDSLKISIARMLAVLHWFNPLVWLVLKKLQNDICLASDELACKHSKQTLSNLRNALLIVQNNAKKSAVTTVFSGNNTNNCEFEENTVTNRLENLVAIQNSNQIHDTFWGKAKVITFLLIMFLALVVKVQPFGSNDQFAGKTAITTDTTDSWNTNSDQRTRSTGSGQFHGEQFNSDNNKNGYSESAVYPEPNNLLEKDANRAYSDKYSDYAGDYSLPLFSDTNGNTSSGLTQKNTTNHSGAVTNDNYVDANFANHSETSRTKANSAARNQPSNPADSTQSDEFASQLLTHDFRSKVFLDEDGKPVNNPAVLLLINKLGSFIRETDVYDILEMIYVVNDSRTKFALLMELTDQLTAQAQSRSSTTQPGEEDLFKSIEQINNILTGSFTVIQSIKSQTIRDNAYSALATRMSYYVGDYEKSKEIISYINNPTLKSNLFMQLGELQRVNDPQNAADTFQLAKTALIEAIKSNTENSSRTSQPTVLSDDQLHSTRRQ